MVDLDLPGQKFDRLTGSTVDKEISRLAATASSVADALKAVDLNSTFHARLGSHVPIEASIAIIGRTAEDLTRLLAAPIRLGVAVIFAGKHPDGRCRIRISEDGTARIEPLGIDFDPSPVSLEAAEVIHETLAELHELMLDPPREPAAEQAVTAPSDAPPLPFNDTNDEIPEPASTAPGASCEPPSICLITPDCRQGYGCAIRA